MSDSTSSTLTARSVSHEDREPPIMKEEVAVEEHIIPISVKREKMIPLNVQTSGPEMRNFPQEETRSRDSGITSRGSSWQSGSFKDGNFSPGSYYTLPVRKASTEKVVADSKDNDNFDYTKVSTLPTIKPLKTKRGYESDMDFTGRGRGDIRVQPQKKQLPIQQDGYTTDIDFRRGRTDINVQPQRKPLPVQQDGYSTDVDFCVRNNRNNHRTNNHDFHRQYSERDYSQRDYVHDMDLDSMKMPQRAKLYDQRGFVSEFDLSSIDSQPEMAKYNQWPPMPQMQPRPQMPPPQIKPPAYAETEFHRRHSESTWSPAKHVSPSPSRQEKPMFTKWTPKNSPSPMRRQGSVDSVSSTSSRGRNIPIQVMHDEREHYDNSPRGIVSSHVLACVPVITAW